MRPAAAFFVDLPKKLRKNTFLAHLSYLYRSAKFINFFAHLFILFYRSPMYETFRTENKVK